MSNTKIDKDIKIIIQMSDRNFEWEIKNIGEYVNIQFEPEIIKHNSMWLGSFPVPSRRADITIHIHCENNNTGTLIFPDKGF